MSSSPGQTALPSSTEEVKDGQVAAVTAVVIYLHAVDFYFYFKTHIHAELQQIQLLLQYASLFLRRLK